MVEQAREKPFSILMLNDVFRFVPRSKVRRSKEKTKDLMPYVLRKDRIQMINNWIEEERHASNK